MLDALRRETAGGSPLSFGIAQVGPWFELPTGRSAESPASRTRRFLLRNRSKSPARCKHRSRPAAFFLFLPRSPNSYRVMRSGPSIAFTSTSSSLTFSRKSCKWNGRTTYGKWATSRFPMNCVPAISGMTKSTRIRRPLRPTPSPVLSGHEMWATRARSRDVCD